MNECILVGLLRYNNNHIHCHTREQFLLAQYLRLKGYPYKFLQKTYGAEDSALQTAYFLHWGKHDNDNNLLLKLLRERYMKKQVI